MEELTTLRPSINTVVTSNLRLLFRKSSSTSFPNLSRTRNRSLLDSCSCNPEPKNIGTPRCFRRRDWHQLLTNKRKNFPSHNMYPDEILTRHYPFILRVPGIKYLVKALSWIKHKGHENKALNQLETVFLNSKFRDILSSGLATRW